MERIQRQNATVYWLSYSPFLQPFTVKAKTAEDLKPEAERIKKRQRPCPEPDNTPVPGPGSGGYLYAIWELPDCASRIFPACSQGSWRSNAEFPEENALEQAIQLVGEEVHRQYVLSFEPKTGEPGRFHAIRVAVRNRPELQAKTREGYWALQ
jgi:hypothetical protein